MFAVGSANLAHTEEKAHTFRKMSVDTAAFLFDVFLSVHKKHDKHLTKIIYSYAKIN